MNFIQTAGVIVAAIALLVNGWFSYQRYRHDKISRSITVTMKLVEEWRSEKSREGKTYIINKLTSDHKPSKGYSELPEPCQTMVVSISHLCDEIATRVISEEANEELILTFLGQRMIQLWDIMAPYIEAERTRRSMPLYQGYFEAFIRKAKETNIDNLIRTRIAKYKSKLECTY